jgi:predicted metal-dependent phosphoesterase TrpH
VIDLHLHTTASDGRLRPEALVGLAAQAGLRVISVTDHDTVAGLGEARDASRRLGIRLVDGIEITAVEDGRDVHVLGYFFDPSNSDLDRFLLTQRSERVERLREMGARLKTLDHAVDVEAIIEAATGQSGRSVGRPALADALIAAGHATDRRDAFDRLLGADRPAFVPRCGPTVARVVEVIVAAGGLASLAHPGLTALDAQIPRFAATGLSALEVRHREHAPEVEAHYRTMARTFGLAVSGGSDFHGDRLSTPEMRGSSPASGPAAQSDGFGQITLAPEDFAALEARQRTRGGDDAAGGAMHPDRPE